MKDHNVADLLSWINGNPGAMTFLTDLLKYNDKNISVPIILKLNNLKSIRGTNLWVLWSDICHKNMNTVYKLLTSDCPNSVLEDACSRQDYSGTRLVEKYIKDE